MVEFILQAVVRKAIEIGSNLIIEAVPHNVREQVNWIQQEMTHIQSYLEDADGKQGDKKVAALVSDIRDLGLEVEDILDKYFPKIASSNKKGFFDFRRNAFGIFGSIFTARNFVAEIEGIKRRVDDIKSRRVAYGIQEKNVNDKGDTYYGRQSFPHYDEPNVVGLEKQIKTLVDKMLDKNSQCLVVSITGMAGLGKTTLAKRVYNAVLGSFECKAWICVSQQPNTKELLRDIARQVELEKEKWETDIEANLFAFLQKKKYVIVVDDIWETKPWDNLKIGLPINFENGSRIILTSRHRDVGVHVGGQRSLHELQPLDANNSRNLFFKIVGGPPKYPEDSSDPPELENMAEKILKRCGGVPLAIVLTAGMLAKKERTIHAWKAVLENMGQEEDECLKIFALSYKDLSTKLKPCFLYFGLFPEDYEIHAFDLINVWEAEGFIQSNGAREVEDVGDDYLNDLIGRNMIQVARRSELDGRVKRVRIHDILHNLCVEKAREYNFFSTHNEVATSNSASKVRRVTTYRNSLREYTSTNNCRTPKLRAMLCFREEDWEDLKKKHVKNVLGDSGYLRVLSFECGSLNISLPSEIGNFGHLSYIRLTGAYGPIKLPSTISNIKSLLTLDFRGCYGGFIIPDCIWKMEQLKHLFLPKRYEINKSDLRGLSLLNRGKFLHPIEASSLNLQTLYGLNIRHWPVKYQFPKFTNLRKLVVLFDGRDLSNIKVLLDALVTAASHKLEVLRLDSGIFIGPYNYYNIKDLNLFGFEKLSRLYLREAIAELQEHVNLLPPNLTKLTLEYTRLEEDPMETLKKLPKLKILKLRLDSYMGQKMMVCSGGRGLDNFPQLQVLEISDLHDLKELTLENEVMPRLNKLTISNSCKRGLIILPRRIRNVSNIIDVPEESWMPRVVESDSQEEEVPVRAFMKTSQPPS